MEQRRRGTAGAGLLARSSAVGLGIGLLIWLEMSGPRAFASEIEGGVEVSSTDPPFSQSDGQLIQDPMGTIDVSLQAGAGIVGGVGHARLGYGWIQVKAFSDVFAGSALPDRNGYVDTTAGGQFTDELTITPANSALLNQPGTVTFAVHVDGHAAKGDGASGVQAGVTIPFQSPGGVPVGFSINNFVGGTFGTTIDETLEFTQDVFFGQPFSMRIVMFGRARATADGTPNFASFAEVDLGNSLEWMGTLGVVDEFDQNVNDYIMSSASGTDYRNHITAPPQLPGDYNNNGAVDAADYVLWRRGGPLANEVDNPGTVDGADYDEWRARFGNPGSGAAATGSASAAVPEPAALLMLSIAMFLVATCRVRFSRSWSPSCGAIFDQSVLYWKNWREWARAVLIVRAAAVELVIVVCGADLWAAAPIKLNGPLVVGGEVDYLGLQFSPDSSLVLYRADQETDDTYELYSVPAMGGTPAKLNGPLFPGWSVYEGGLQFSPDSSRVLYIANQDEEFEFDLYSVPATGGTETKLNHPLDMFGSVFGEGLQFSPDSSRVVYVANQGTGVLELYSVPATGGTPVKLNGPLVTNGNVNASRVRISSDSSRVLYLADQDTDGVDEVYSVPTTGGTVVKLNGPLVAGGDVFTPLFSPDSSHVVYRADQDTDNVFEIYSVPAGGGTRVKLNAPLAPGGQATNYQISPDSSRVVYRADQDTDELFELYSVPLTGGAPIKLNHELAAGDAHSFGISPDSSRVLYFTDQGSLIVAELYSVPLTGGAAVKLNGPLVAGGSVTGGAKFSSDGSRVIYRADQATDENYEIFSVPSTGGTAVNLNAPLVAGGDIYFFDFSPDGSRVIYLGDQDSDAVNELYLVPSTGGTPVKLNGPLVTGGEVGSYEFSPDGSKVMYTADQDTDNVNEIYVRIVRQHSLGGAGNWDAGAAWDHGGEPDEVMQVFVDGPGTVYAAGLGAAPRTINELVVGGGSGTSTLALSDGADITTLHGATIKSGGVLRGDGELVANLVVAAGGEVRAGAGDRLAVNGASVSNAGRVEAIGTALDLAEIEFDGAVTNSAGTGSIIARNAILRFDGGLTNNSAMALSFGTSDILGDVTNSASGTIAVAGNSGVTFYDDVTNSGTLNVASGSTAVFFGALSGNGNVGSGDVQALGDLLPGASPGTMAFGGDLTLGPLTNLEIELGGLTAGSQFDQLVIAGDATLAGLLDVSLVNGFTLALGQSFEIVDITGARNGTFSGLSEGAMVGNVSGQDLFITYAGGNGNDVVLFVPGLPGDYNNSGAVDAADYVVWRKNPSGFPADAYATWRTHFGQTAGSGSAVGADATVPEPATMVMTMFAGAGWCLRRRRTE